MRLTNSQHSEYVAPEIVQLGHAADLTLGQTYQQYLDACVCSKAAPDDDDLLGC